MNTLLTINNGKPKLYDDLYKVAGEFQKSDPSRSRQAWYQRLMRAYTDNEALVNTGTDGNRLRAEKTKALKITVREEA